MPTIARVHRFPTCNFSTDGHLATYDFKTNQGPWANACLDHYLVHRAYSDLGTGKGQRLVLLPSTAQARVLNTEGVTLLGYDEAGRPVAQGESGIPKQTRTWALLRNGDPTDIQGEVTTP